ncbi:MAG: (deoxy)nucleoside triphosphate pyrophosphohydrolase [Gemmatimonadetes bacterium]|nr:(deoxy)nucleoside triphosphate pyrophosphohydrolase [Gemmatimonadota bacterium]
MHVVAAVVRRDGRYLVGRRPDEKRHGGLWEFPGGKVDPGESWLEAAHRELGEELGMEALSLGEPLLTVADEGSPYVILFVAVDAAGEPVPTEHSAIGWFTPPELAELPLAPADARFVATLQDGP